MANNALLPLSDKVCVICRLDILFDERNMWSNVGPSGLQSLLHYSSLRSDNELNVYLTQNPSSVKVHDLCRKQYVCKRKYEQQQRAKGPTDTENVPIKSLRSPVDKPFDWKEHCLLCGDPAKSDRKHPNLNKISHVETLEIRASILQYCVKRCDSWGMEVQSRLNTCNDLVAVEAVYHRSCYAVFTAMRSNPSKDSKSATVGGKVCESKLETFETLCLWIELCDDELYTLTELHSKLGEIAFGDEERVYSKQQLKRKLEEKYGDHMFFAEVAGKHNVICFVTWLHVLLMTSGTASRSLKLRMRAYVS